VTGRDFAPSLPRTRGRVSCPGVRCALPGLVMAFVSLFSQGEASYAQQPAGPRHITVIAPAFKADSDEAKAFREGLRAAGYVEGRELAIDWWYGQGSYNGVDEAVARAVRDHPDVIVVESTVAALAAHRATQTIPIVMAYVGDPVGVGLVESLRHPGGNVTGLTNMAAELAPKRLQLLKEVVPTARRIGVLFNPDTPMHSTTLAQLKAAMPHLQLELVTAPARQADQLGRAFSKVTRSKVDAILVLGDPFMASNGETLVQLAARVHLPLSGDWRGAAKQGVLVGYWTQPADLLRRTAGYVDKILKGASPATLPVEQPTKFEMFVNLRTAKGLGLTIPESVLLQATEVIR